jgi:hypothetical protein
MEEEAYAVQSLAKIATIEDVLLVENMLLLFGIILLNIMIVSVEKIII